MVGAAVRPPDELGRDRDAEQPVERNRRLEVIAYQVEARELDRGFGHGAAPFVRSRVQVSHATQREPDDPAGHRLADVSSSELVLARRRCEPGAVESTGAQGRDPRLLRARRVVERLIREESVVAHTDGSVHRLFPVAIGEEEARALRDLVVSEHAVMTIEIGLGYGMSALSICEGLCTNGQESARHVVVDPHQSTRFADLGLQSLEEAGFADMVEHHAEESLVTLPRLLAEGRQFDLAFVDGNHRFDGVLVDLVYLGRLVRSGGLVFLDDYQLPAVARAVSFFQANLGWTLEQVSATDALHQWAVLRTSHEPDRRPFDHFVDF